MLEGVAPFSARGTRAPPSAAANSPDVTVRVGTPGQRQQDNITIAGNPALAALAPSLGAHLPFSRVLHNHAANSILQKQKLGCLVYPQGLLIFRKNSGLGIRTSLADSVTNWEFNPELDQSLSASPVLTCKFPGPTIQAVRSRDPSTCPDPTPVTEMSAFLLKSDPVASHSSWAPRGQQQLLHGQLGRGNQQTNSPTSAFSSLSR